MTKSEVKDAVLGLSHAVGLPAHALAILGEGNTSGKISDDSFWVKASGTNLATLGDAGLVECATKRILRLFGETEFTDEDIEEHLLDSRVDHTAKKPSVECVFHGYLLTLPGIRYVAHTHPITVNQILCSPHSERFATSRLFPDEIVCCGSESVLVPYTDPGLVLARNIRDRTDAFLQKHGLPPRVILLQNHGAITLGPTPQAAEAAMLMLEKSAKIFVGAAALGGPVFLTPENVHRIANRIDEHYRQKQLNL
ncbi:MAG TPA: class II aldolase/adducin family protein [Chthoniobacterales bacterium]|jgi:rhamnose utilization protein RhaD (predicted bifunctional aldolase and dehydrogenase)